MSWSARLKKTPGRRAKRPARCFRWLPDLDVFTDIDIPKEYFEDTLKRQAVVNAGHYLPVPHTRARPASLTRPSICYENGILDYVREIASGHRR